MSNQRLAATYKLETEGFTSTELAVLRWLAWRENKDDRRCDPGYPDIETGTGLKETAIRTALKRLRKRGVVTWKNRGDTSNSFTLNLPSGTKGSKGTTLGNQGTQPSPSEEGKPSPSEDKPKRTKNLKEEPNEEKAASQLKEEAAAAFSHPEEDAELKQQVGKVFEHWKAVTGRDASTRVVALGDKRERAVVRALGVYETEEVCEAIGNWKLSDWFSGRKANDRKVRNDLTHLLETDEVIEELRDLSRRPAPESPNERRKRIRKEQGLDSDDAWFSKMIDQDSEDEHESSRDYGTARREWLEAKGVTA